MTIQFHILSASGKLTGQKRVELETVLQDAALICSKKLVLGDIDIVVKNEPRGVIPKIGVNGFSFGANEISLTLDIDHEHLLHNFEETISALLVG